LTQDQVVREAKKRAPIGTPKTTGIPDYIVAHSYQKSIRREPPTKQRAGARRRHGGIINVTDKIFQKPDKKRRKEST